MERVIVISEIDITCKDAEFASKSYNLLNYGEVVRIDLEELLDVGFTLVPT